MRLVLFDIDGTLLLTGGIGQSSAEASLKRVFGTAGRVDQFYPTGRTIEAIFEDTLLDAGFSREEYQHKRELLYADFFEEFTSRLDQNEHQIGSLPGAKPLVAALSQQEDVILGLTTGNHQRTAGFKLRTAGFDLEMFKVGAYGNETTHRPDLVLRAHARAEALAGEGIAASHTFVIGDTARDVQSAQAFGAVSVAVSTGMATSSDLAAALPDYMLPDLQNIEQVLAVILARP
ncbi:MAG: HAD family hydrolase [Anaerolineales bacterium]|nr:HAD family hydrolase [Anaerolineales bacterium]